MTFPPALSLGTLLSGAALAAWLYLFLAHGKGGRCASGFWRIGARLPAAPAPFEHGAPPIIAVIPARNEADHVGDAIASLMAQEYPGPFQIIVVNDRSTDPTGDILRERAATATSHRPLTIIDGVPPADGWSGKLWALQQGLDHLRQHMPAPRYLLLTDADIDHAADTLQTLVAFAENENRVLVSLMAHLRMQRFWERLLLPAFIFFFRKLYPFADVNAPASRQAAAAGGCILVRADLLEESGGLAAIHHEIIDDCALARQLKTKGAIWLGLSRRVRSLRPYDRLAEIWQMVTRTAYAQLHHSPLWLAGAALGMGLLYLVPPAALVVGLGTGAAVLALFGGAAWLLMTVSYLPVIRYYGQPWWLALTLPVAGVMFTLMTLDSGRRHLTGSGAVWKGRRYG